jgi:hypothetical protein
MISKKIFSVCLILLLFAGMSFVSATVADYNHDGKVDITDNVDQIKDAVNNIDDYNHDGKVDITDGVDKVIDTVDNKVNAAEIQDTENNQKIDVDNGAQVSANQSSDKAVEQKQYVLYDKWGKRTVSKEEYDREYNKYYHVQKINTGRLYTTRKNMTRGELIDQCDDAKIKMNDESLSADDRKWYSEKYDYFKQVLARNNKYPHPAYEHKVKVDTSNKKNQTTSSNNPTTNNVNKVSNGNPSLSYKIEKISQVTLNTANFLKTHLTNKLIGFFIPGHDNTIRLDDIMKKP